jgi:uncharacterized membrane protein
MNVAVFRVVSHADLHKFTEVLKAPAVSIIRAMIVLMMAMLLPDCTAQRRRRYPQALFSGL